MNLRNQLRVTGCGHEILCHITQHHFSKHITIPLIHSHYVYSLGLKILTQGLKVHHGP